MKRIGTEDGTREYQPLALEVVGGLDIGEYDYSELREVEPVSDSLLRMGDRLGQGFIWDVSEDGLVLRHEPRSVTGSPYYTTLGWGESLKVKEQNPTGQIVGKVTVSGIQKLSKGDTPFTMPKLAKAPKLQVFTVQVHPDDVAAMDKIAKHQNTSRSEIIRQFISKGLTQKSMVAILEGASAKETS